MISITLLSGCTTGFENSYPSISTVDFNLYSPAIYDAEGYNTTIRLTVENHDTVVINVVNCSISENLRGLVFQTNITGITELQPDESQVITITFLGKIESSQITRINIIVEKEGILYITGKGY